MGESGGVESESRRWRQRRPTHQWCHRPGCSVVPGSRVHISGDVDRFVVRGGQRSRLGDCPFSRAWAATFGKPGAEGIVTMSQTKKRKLKEKKAPELPVLNPTAAGVDIGATEIYVAVHPDCDPQPVRSPPSPRTSIGWQTASRWNPPASIGFRCFRSWKSVDSKSVRTTEDHVRLMEVR